MLVLRTEETLLDELNSYASVIDLQGNTLMAEVLVGANRKRAVTKSRARYAARL